MIDIAMVGRNPARYLAPVALAATIAGGYVIVHHNTTSHAPRVAAGHSRSAQNGTVPRGKFAKSRFYVVQPGDSLTSISIKTGLSLATLERLNPRVDPNSLQTGQRLRLRR
jgi:LysM repeat protein